MTTIGKARRPLPPPPPPPPPKPAAPKSPAKAPAPKSTPEPRNAVKAETTSPIAARPVADKTPATAAGVSSPTPARKLASPPPRDDFSTQAPRDASVNPGIAPQAAAGQTPPAPRFAPLDKESATAQSAFEASKAAIPQQQPQLDARDSFRIKSAAQDEFGTVHVRMDRLHNKITVQGDQLIGHVAQDGSVTVTGDFRRMPPELGSGPSAMSPQTAAERLSASLGAQPGEITPDKLSRVIAQGEDGQYRDSWMLSDVDAHGEPRNALISSEDGRVTSQDTHAHLAQGTAGTTSAAPRPLAPADRVLGAAQGNDQSTYSGWVEVGGTPVGTDGQQQLLDTTRGQGIETLDAQGSNSRFVEGQAMIDNNGAWAEAGDPQGQQTAVDAQYGAQMTYDFYKDVLGRDSIDGKGQKLVSVVNARLEDGAGNLAPNAFWDGKRMVYGMGDGKEFGNMTALDVTGHEISHGLTQHAAGVQGFGESGGVNESLSDIMGTGVEWYASQRNPHIQSNFTIGEDLYTPGVEGDALRYMDDPTRDGKSIDHYSHLASLNPDKQGPLNDNGGVHYSSGIMNNAFTLMAQGGSNRTSGLGVDKPMGMEDALRIFGRAQQYYMTPNTTFPSAREYTERAAADLYGEDSPQVRAVRQAWTAVGVEGRPAVG